MTQKHSKVVQDVSVKQRYLFLCNALSKQIFNEFLLKNTGDHAGIPL